VISGNKKKQNRKKNQSALSSTSLSLILIRGVFFSTAHRLYLSYRALHSFFFSAAVLSLKLIFQRTPPIRGAVSCSRSWPSARPGLLCGQLCLPLPLSTLFPAACWYLPRRSLSLFFKPPSTLPWTPESLCPLPWQPSGRAPPLLIFPMSRPARAPIAVPLAALCQPSVCPAELLPARARISFLLHRAALLAVGSLYPWRGSAEAPLLFFLTRARSPFFFPAVEPSLPSTACPAKSRPAAPGGRLLSQRLVPTPCAAVSSKLAELPCARAQPLL
jgi:hypothetical protein